MNGPLAQLVSQWSNIVQPRLSILLQFHAMSIQMQMLLLWIMLPRIKTNIFYRFFPHFFFFLSVHIFAKNMLAGTYFNMNSIKPVSMCDKEL